MVRRNPAPRLAGARLPFVVWFFGFLAVTFILTDRYKISTDREIFVGGSSDLIDPADFAASTLSILLIPARAIYRYV
jgi:hypothetical protein